MKPPYLRKLERRSDLTIWLVDGKYVREHLYQDFTQGGHEFIYDFIPHNEIWLDDDLSVDERPAVIAHEIYERSLMLKKVPYDLAHNWANRIEASVRRVKELTGHKLD
jgi:hypothetical protein